METFDLVVIGGGPAGYVASGRAGAAGLKTALIEKNALGGVCLNEGCIPSKAFLNSAKILGYAKHGEEYGVFVETAGIDHNRVRERKNRVVKALVAGVVAGLKRNKVAIFRAEGKIVGKSGGVFAIQAGGDAIAAKKILLACGSAAITPPIPGVREAMSSGVAITNKEIFDLEDVPRDLVIIGGGVIGLEMASYFNAAGSNVTIVEILSKIAGPTEGEISDILLKNLKKDGIEFRLNSRVVSIDNEGVTFEENSVLQHASADKILLSVGRRANVDGLGLESIGVCVERSAVVTDENMRTNVSGVYAAGDINGKSMLAHTASREGEVAVNHMLGKKDRMRYGAIPSVIYTNPEAAGVGETEETAREKGLDVRSVSVPMRFSGRYVAEAEKGDGICKIVIDRKFDRLMGVHMIGGSASEIIYGAAMMIEMEMKTDDIKEIVFPHPSACEVIREGLFL
ncbi:MAG: dihydrolipoyl dehydrogenase [Synergistaceae bacterium]|nr:dihydrolipoyl dehydrogenase [Synergistaceae bacterium]